VTDVPVDVERLARAEGSTIDRRPPGDDDGETVGRCITVNSDQPLCGSVSQSRTSSATS
jgi:hypothetical protein